MNTQEDEQLKTYSNKREVKKDYLDAKIGLFDALCELMLTFGLDRLEALRYLGL